MENIFYSFLYVFIYLGDLSPWHECGGQRTAYKCWFFLSTMWTLRIKLQP